MFNGIKKRLDNDSANHPLHLGRVLINPPVQMLALAMSALPSGQTSQKRESMSALGQERTHALQQTASLFTVRGAGVALLGRLALTVAQNLGIAAERIHDCGRDEFDAG